MTNVEQGVDAVLDVPTDFDGHVVPSGWDHEASSLCWCHPRIDYTDQVNGGRVWVHVGPA